jgi:hypothetical protein
MSLRSQLKGREGDRFMADAPQKRYDIAINTAPMDKAVAP